MESKDTGARLRISASIGGARYFADDYFLTGEYDKVDLMDIMDFLRESIRQYREERARIESDKRS